MSIKRFPRPETIRQRGSRTRKASPNDFLSDHHCSTRSAGETRKLNIFCSDYVLQEKNAGKVLNSFFEMAYSKFAVAKSTAEGLATWYRQRRTLRHNDSDGALSTPVYLRSGGLCVGALRGWSVFVRALPTCIQAATPLLGNRRGGSDTRQRNRTMKHPLSTLLERRAASQRAMAYAALRADSSLSVRRNRYNHHIEKARAAEAALSRLATPSTSLNQEPRHA